MTDTQHWTRFAPAPTGYLHLGHVANAIFVWGAGSTLGARVRLRIEDHDRSRSRQAFEVALLEDLDWLGFVPATGREPLVRQHERESTYLEALEHLDSAGLIYSCDCSRRVIGTRPYSGHCRTRRLPRTRDVGLRVCVDPGEEVFTDLLEGEQRQAPRDQCGDLLVRDRRGHWTYQFAVTVDDFREQIDLVIRGQDLLESTGRQLRLARLLGRRDHPRYLHHPLVTHADGHKLSKAAGDSGVRDLRAAGYRPEEVIGLAATAVGLLETPRSVPAAAVDTLFRAPLAQPQFRLPIQIGGSGLA